MKTEEELNNLNEEVKTLNKKLAELTKEELEQISGGVTIPAPGEYGHSTSKVFELLLDTVKDLKEQAENLS